jgi:AhpD family alkylhydroperoxidase
VIWPSDEGLRVTPRLRGASNWPPSSENQMNIGWAKGEIMDFKDFGMIKAQAEAGDPLFSGAYSGTLTEQERHLIGIIVAVTKGCPDCTAARLAKAREAGIQDIVIKEAINLAAGVNSGFVVTTAVKGSQKT